MTDALDRFISAEAREAIRAPIESARTLPRETFSSSEFARLELERIFHHRWVALCFAGEVPDVGDVLPLDAFDLPLLVTRAEDGVVRVFHNIVPYDGCLAAIEPQTGVLEIETAYHGWRYDLTGRLLSVPYWDGSVEGHLDSLAGKPGDLAPVRSEIALGVVFVDLSGEAEPFSEFFRPVRETLEDYRLDDLALGVEANGQALVRQDELGTNWKTLLENDCMNILHESFVHALYRKSPEVPRADAQGNPRFEIHTRGCVLAFSYAEADVVETYPPLAAPSIGIDPKRDPERGYFLTLYPNLTIAVMPQQISPCIVWPLGSDRCRIGVAALFEPTFAADPKHAATRAAAEGVFAEASEEDARVMEAVQSARRSPAFDSQFYAPFWDALNYRFNQLVLDDVERAATEED